MTSALATETNTLSSTLLAPAGPLIRVAPGASSVSIWSPALFSAADSSQVREFIARVFTLNDVNSVEIRRSEAFARVRFEKSGDPRSIWRDLSRAFRISKRAEDLPAVTGLYLDGPPNIPLEVRRVGATLSSWRVRYQSHRRLRLSHPILLRRRDVAHRLEEALTSLLGVKHCRSNTISGSVTISFDPALISPERVTRRLEQYWPFVLSGLDGAPSGTRLLAASGLFALAATSRFFVPALRPVAVVGVAIYSAPNVTTALRQLRNFKAGLPALYSFGLGLMLVSGMPFNATLFAVLMQFWPQLAQGTLSRSRRRLFATYRQPSGARLFRGAGNETDVDIETLKDGDVILVRRGDIVPVDGLVVEGLAAIDEEEVSGLTGAIDKTAGDKVFASSYVRDGALKVRVSTTGGRAVADEISRLLPRSVLDALPSAREAERIANRNARPALALAVASLFVRRGLRPAQAIIRPDYITAYRWGAQLAALYSLGDALQHGILFRRPEALDLLAGTNIYVIDESAALHRRKIEVAEVFTVTDVPSDDILRFAASAYPPSQNDRADALQERCDKAGLARVEVYQRRRIAGAIGYTDERNHRLEIGCAELGFGSKFPRALKAAISASVHATAFDPASQPEDPLLRPLIVRREGKTIGAIAFGRTGGYEAAEAIAKLRMIDRGARFVHISTRPQVETAAVAGTMGMDTAIGDLDPSDKARVIRQLGARTLWIGDGTAPGSLPSIRAARVSLSVAGFGTIGKDASDIVLLQPSLYGLLPLRRIAHDHRARIDADYRAMYIANLTGVVGGLFAGFGGLQSGLVSNAGTAYLYFLHRRRLRQLVTYLESRRALQTTAGREDPGRFSGKTALVSYGSQPQRMAPREARDDQRTWRPEGI